LNGANLLVDFVQIGLVDFLGGDVDFGENDNDVNVFHDAEQHVLQRHAGNAHVGSYQHQALVREGACDATHCGAELFFMPTQVEERN